MSSKANAPRRNGLAKRFAKDGKRLERSGRYPMQELKDVGPRLRGDDKNGRGDDDLLLLFGQKPVELVGEALAVGGVQRRRPAGAFAGTAQLVEVIP